MRLAFLGIAVAAVPVLGEVRPLEVAGAPFPLTVGEWTQPARDFPITAYGAKPDGTAVTEAIERAVAAANAAGGGRVVVPPGEWITGAFRLTNDVALVLDEQAVLRFPDDPTLVMRAPLKADGFPTMTHWALIGASGCTNVAILGRGTIRCDVDYWHRNFLVNPERFRGLSPQDCDAVQVDLMIQTDETLYVVEVKRRKRILPTIVDEVKEKLRKIGRPKRISVRKGLIYDGDLSPAVRRGGYFDAIVDIAAFFA